MSANFHENVNKIERALLAFARTHRGAVTARKLAEVAAGAVGDTRPTALEEPMEDIITGMDEFVSGSLSHSRRRESHRHRKTKRSQNGWVR